MEIAKIFLVPIEADSVLSPQVHYGQPLTGIYFITNDDKYGRITFETLDSLKISRGEVFPFKVAKGETLPLNHDLKYEEQSWWVSKVENSSWLKERYDYENKYYGDSYGFGQDVNEMLIDFGHYVFSFHDQFVEVIAKGFWFEKDTESLFGKPLQPEHPSLPLPEINMSKFSAHGLTSQVRINPKPIEELIFNAQYCSQKLMEFFLEGDEKPILLNTLYLFYRNGKLMSSFKASFGKEIKLFEGVATLKEVEPYLEAKMREISERRESMKKK